MKRWLFWFVLIYASASIPSFAGEGWLGEWRSREREREQKVFEQEMFERDRQMKERMREIEQRQRDLEWEMSTKQRKEKW